MANFNAGGENESLQETSAQPQLCSNNCGFFANVGCMGLCSKCHREIATQAQTAAAAEAAVDAAVRSPTSAAAAAAAIVPRRGKGGVISSAAPSSPTHDGAGAAFKDTQTVADAARHRAAANASAATVLVGPSVGTSEGAGAAFATGDPPGTPPSGPGATPSRCQQCRKKVGLTGFKCKCGLTFCGQHRYAEAHQCSYDYKTQERQKLQEKNPLVQAAKVQRF